MRNNVALWLVGIIICGILIPGESSLADEESPDELESQRQMAAESRKEQFEVSEKLLKRFPNDLDAILLMASAYGSQHNSAEAMKYWQQALRRAPGDPKTYYQMAEYAMRRGEFTEAAPLWRKVLQLAPKTPKVHSHLAAVLMEQGLIHEAIVELEKEIEISPQSDFSYYMLGRGYLQLKEYEKAQNYYEKALEIDSRSMNTHYGLATVYARLGRKEESREILRELKARDTERSATLRSEEEFATGVYDSASQDLAATHTIAGRVWSQRGYAWQAEKHWRRAAKVAPKDTACRLALLSLFKQTDRAADAVPIYEQLIEIAPHNITFCFQQGILYLHLERFDEASRSFRRLIERWPEQPIGYRALAELHLRRGQKLPEAKTLATKAVELSPIAASYFLLSQACEKNGDRPDALEALREAIRLNPKNATYQKRLKQIQDSQ